MEEAGEPDDDNDGGVRDEPTSLQLGGGDGDGEQLEACWAMIELGGHAWDGRRGATALLGGTAAPSL